MSARPVSLQAPAPSSVDAPPPVYTLCPSLPVALQDAAAHPHRSHVMCKVPEQGSRQVMWTLRLPTHRLSRRAACPAAYLVQR